MKKILLLSLFLSGCMISSGYNGKPDVVDFVFVDDETTAPEAAQKLCQDNYGTDQRGYKVMRWTYGADKKLMKAWCKTN
jgi:hypothetical protein